MLTKQEQSVLEVFRHFLMGPGKMLCFYGPNLKKHKPALRQLIEKEFMVEEKFHGGYSLTNAGYKAMKEGTVPV